MRHLEQNTPKPTDTPAASNKRDHEVPTTVENQDVDKKKPEEILREGEQSNLEINDNNRSQPKKIQLPERFTREVFHLCRRFK